jgi:hypothetical protein
MAMLRDAAQPNFALDVQGTPVRAKLGKSVRPIVIAGMGSQHEHMLVELRDNDALVEVRASESNQWRGVTGTTRYETPA